MNNLLLMTNVVLIANVLSLYLLESDQIKNWLIGEDIISQKSSIIYYQLIWMSFICMFYLIQLILIFFILSLWIQIKSEKKINPFNVTLRLMIDIFFNKHLIYFYVILSCVLCTNFTFILYNYINKNTENKNHDSNFIYYWSLHIFSIFLLSLLLYFISLWNVKNVWLMIYIIVYLILNSVLIVSICKNIIYIPVIIIFLISVFGFVL